MNWNPLTTLTGRMVLVTVAAVVLSYAVAFFIFTNERGAALRRSAETAVVERIAYTAERLREAPAEARAEIAMAIRDFGLRYRVTGAPATRELEAKGTAGRVQRALSARLGGARVFASADVREGRMRRRERQPPPSDAPWNERAPAELERERLVQFTNLELSVELSDGSWLNAHARLPGPRPAPFGVLVSALVSVVLVGAGAALVSRQIGRPLADLASAARALGAGETNVATPVRGPEDVRRAASAFNAMAERLGRQLSRQRQMLWALSHDLRTPITALKLRAELVEDEPARQRLLAPIMEMERLTEQALALARAGASDEERIEVDLAEIVQTLCIELGDMGVNVRAETAAPVVVECRPAEIARALRNLAENAAKYGGGGVMRAYRNDAGEAVAEVLDEGPGVPAESLSRLCAPFYRGDDARSGPAGAGLGLAIAQAIAEAHGGRLVLANRTPRGFSAALVLP